MGKGVWTGPVVVFVNYAYSKSGRAIENLSMINKILEGLLVGTSVEFQRGRNMQIEEISIPFRGKKKYRAAG